MPVISVTKPFLPPLGEYVAQLEKVWAAGQLTNSGPLVQQLERELAARTEVPYVQVFSNGTQALQIAVRALDLTKEIITTPFSYVATTTAILWAQCKPSFVDIEEDTFCIDPRKIEAAITPDTQAILATHIYGHPCDVRALQQIADKHGLKVIYDAAHAFDVKVGDEPIVRFGDASMVSFHATKLFHTAEGGALFTANDRVARAAGLLRNFGFSGDEYYRPGTNAKESELHAAMGLSVLPHVPSIIGRRKLASELYDAALKGADVRLPKRRADVTHNYAYYPVVLPSESRLLRAAAHLADAGIGTRRYFYPSLNRLPYVEGAPCPVSEDIARRVLCLPLHHDVGPREVEQITAVLLAALRS